MKQLELMLDVRKKDIIGDKNKKYLYESPDGGQTIYRREFGKSEKEIVKDWQEKINERKAFIERADKGNHQFDTYKKFRQDLKSNDGDVDQSIEKNLKWYEKWKKENFNSEESYENPIDKDRKRYAG